MSIHIYIFSVYFVLRKKELHLQSYWSLVYSWGKKSSFVPIVIATFDVSLFFALTVHCIPANLTHFTKHLLIYLPHVFLRNFFNAITVNHFQSSFRFVLFFTNSCIFTYKLQLFHQSYVCTLTLCPSSNFLISILVHYYTSLHQLLFSFTYYIAHVS